jgi:hypothetical protein
METREQSEFNSAVTYLNRLNYLWAVTDEARSECDAYRWFNHLCIIYSELSTEMKKKEERAIYKQRFSDLNIRVQQQMHINQRSSRQQIEWSLMAALIDLDEDLRRVMKEAGLQTKSVSDPRHAMM